MRSLGVVLYVDDEPINLKLFNIMFRGVYKIVTAESGAEALRILDGESEVSVVITDMKMPSMNGLEFVSAARKIRADIPYFLLSGYGLTPEIEKALKLEWIDGYFQKPLKKSKIEEELARYLP
ncbi:response regulator [Saccharicrinis fermentans]|uniref:Quorum-sensing regulator protein F n=1 Tax=Saccharicrinis fermentans DSM 9555 = JCM 21142 TaxID=869213 RepID=W7YNC6_9BACT|nr:response regulator [Saccharicrinis fermentans]GAF03939.1 quorum-sensing regulator protein F [Saccharicrinis fermentans DSM 9555 = JCM 21142]